MEDDDDNDESMEDDQDFDDVDEEEFGEEDFDDEEKEEEEEETPTMKEDIYGRMIDAKGNIVKNNSSEKNLTKENRYSSVAFLYSKANL